MSSPKSTTSVLRPLARALTVSLGCALLAGCAASPGGGKKGKYMFEEGPRWGVAAKRRYNDGEAIPPGGGRSMVGKAYEVDGKTYVPREDVTYDRVGMASWYGIDFHGRDTSNGEVYDRHTLSAAHTTMPLPSYARVTNMRNGKSVIVRVNDRGPFVAGREIDLSEKAADMLGYKGQGVAQVRVQYVGPAPVAGSNQAMLASTFRDAGARASIAADRTQIARAEGVTMPSIATRDVQVARLDLPSAPSRIDATPSSLKPLAAQGQAPWRQPVPAGQPVLPPIAAMAVAAPPKPQGVVVPQEILNAVRPQAKPVMAASFGHAPVAVAPAPTAPVLLPRRKPPTPDDSLPLGWDAPVKGVKSYAASDRQKLDAIFARVTSD